ncbi:unnamed protein product [Rhizoctonia solani]|uniref:GH16 domain-containing protein n=1 Tax=Rhizoctonia solani TaxID=456999 RepID=A0A8H3E2I4_9AGAM|nr:unnamed protein product [Rhizoctonia solani]
MITYARNLIDGFLADAAAPAIPQLYNPEESMDIDPVGQPNIAVGRISNGFTQRYKYFIFDSTIDSASKLHLFPGLQYLMIRSLLFAPLAITVASAATLAERQSTTCDCGYKDSTGAVWRESFVSDFTAAAGAEAVLSQKFYKFNYPEPHPDSPNNMNYNPNNVYAYNYGLGMKTSAYSGSGLVQTAGIGTLHDMKYGTFRMRATVPSVPGVCFGFFTYKNVSNVIHEADVEFLSSDADYYQRVYHTNQPGLVNGNTDPDASKSIVIPGADFTEFHEHRLDWLPGSSKYYYDGSLKSTVNKNSPAVDSPLYVNVWSDGGPLWSRGPPTQDAIATIYYIKGYYNSSAVSESQFNTRCAAATNKTPCSV